jgi:MazG family protein
VTAGDDSIVDSSSAAASNAAASGGIAPSKGALDRALAIVEFLRANCPWDRVQTAESLIPYLIEESQEVVDAIRSADARELEGELGDLLLNVAFQIVLAEEAEAFDRNSVVDRLEAKMRRRHPHLFGEGERENWEALKARELPRDESVLSGLPAGLDPLLRAHRIQEKLSGVGFDWEDAEGARLKVAEELEEMRVALERGDPGEVMEEAGDLLFTAVNLARLAGVHASNALARTNRKVEARFRRVEELARDGGQRVAEMSLEELDALWDAVKAEARVRASGDSSAAGRE